MKPLLTATGQAIACCCIKYVRDTLGASRQEINILQWGRETEKVNNNPTNWTSTCVVINQQQPVLITYSKNNFNDVQKDKHNRLII